MHPFPAIAAQQYDVFTTEQARADGWSPSATRHARRVGALISPRAGTFARPTDPDDPDRLVVATTRAAVAAALTHRDADVSHLAAAHLWGLPVVVRRPRPCVTVPPGARRRAARVHLHRATVPTGHRGRLGLVAVTGSARTVVDCAREFGTEVALAMLDAGLRTGRVSAGAVERVLAHCENWPGAGRADPLLRHADARAESPLESCSRWRLRLAGLPAPTLQERIVDADGRFLGRVDFYWDEVGTVGEADGRVKYAGPEGVRAALAQGEREAALRRAGLQVERWGWHDLDAFDDVRTRLLAAFAEGVPPEGRRRWRVDRSPRRVSFAVAGVAR